MKAETIIFADDFDGPALGSAWQVWAGSGAYSLAGGSLRYANQGPLSGPAGWSTTSLSLALPFSGTHWQLDVKATYNLYWLNPVGNSSGVQSSQLIVSFDEGAPFTDYADFDRRIDAWYGANLLSGYYNYPSGQPRNDGLMNPADAAIQNNIANGTYWLRVKREGGDLALLYSYDGSNYATGLSTTLANPAGTFNRLVISGMTWETVGSFTDYEGVKIVDTTVPEPASMALVGAGLVAVSLLQSRRRRGKAMPG